jgi:hypothetical protein
LSTKKNLATLVVGKGFFFCHCVDRVDRTNPICNNNFRPNFEEYCYTKLNNVGKEKERLNNGLACEREREREENENGQLGFLL